MRNEGRNPMEEPWRGGGGGAAGPSAERFQDVDSRGRRSTLKFHALPDFQAPRGSTEEQGILDELQEMRSHLLRCGVKPAELGCQDEIKDLFRRLAVARGEASPEVVE